VCSFAACMVLITSTMTARTEVGTIADLGRAIAVNALIGPSDAVWACYPSALIVLVFVVSVTGLAFGAAYSSARFAILAFLFCPSPALHFFFVS
jgi:hypothetical protein